MAVVEYDLLEFWSASDVTSLFGGFWKNSLKFFFGCQKLLPIGVIFVDNDKGG